MNIFSDWVYIHTREYLNIARIQPCLHLEASSFPCQCLWFYPYFASLRPISYAPLLSKNFRFFYHPRVKWAAEPGRNFGVKILKARVLHRQACFYFHLQVFLVLERVALSVSNTLKMQKNPPESNLVHIDRQYLGFIKMIHAAKISEKACLAKKKKKNALLPCKKGCSVRQYS